MDTGIIIIVLGKKELGGYRNYNNVLGSRIVQETWYKLQILPSAVWPKAGMAGQNPSIDATIALSIQGMTDSIKKLYI